MMVAHPQPHNGKRLLVKAKGMASLLRITCLKIKAKDTRVAAITCVNFLSVQHAAHHLSITG
eukprot:12398602-Karenia_brevis.AAC.1